jgi:hypothetical protein
MKISGAELYRQLGETSSPTAPDPRFRLIPGRNEFIVLADSADDLLGIQQTSLAENLDLGYFVLPLNQADYTADQLRVRPPEGTEVYFPVIAAPNAVTILSDMADSDDLGASLTLDGTEESGALLASAIGLNLPIRIVTQLDPAAVLLATARMETEDISPREWVREVLSPTMTEIDEAVAEELTDWIISITSETTMGARA